MAFSGKLLQPLLALGVLIVLILVASAASKPNSVCKRKCGQVEIPYPFGISEGCYLDSKFLITCNNTFYPPKPSLGPDMFVENISVLDGELRVSNPVASLCKVLDYNKKKKANIHQCIKRSIYSSCASNDRDTMSISVNYSGNSALFKLSNFRISDKRNKITAVGCGVYSFIQGSKEQKGFTTGCLSLCNNNASDVVNRSCSGIGCCQTSIPKGATEFNLSVRILSDNTKTISIGECAYGFIVEEKAYNFLSSDFQDFKNRTTVPLVLDWAVGNEACKEAKKNKDTYGCKATDNYNKSRVLGQGGCGVVYKGILSDNRVVAIKKSKIGDQSQIEQFINEVIVLTQINHRNVVKLLGCCLETEVPMLVYEFITNGTLSDHLHDKSRSSLLSWDKRLKIATETACALAYLHYEASMPIIHRDVKTANILLDENHTAKVSDFGASRIVPLDQTQLTTLVQGAFGYLDPEYFHTSHLTDKSDVYSFGVVLTELLTGKKVISFDRPESERNLATYFVSTVKEDRLVEVLDDNIHNGSNVEELKKVANVTKRCLSVKGDDRPTMKEVAVELDGLRVQGKQVRKEANLNTKESEYSLSASAHSLSIDVGVGYSSTGTIDSMGNQALKPTDDGR
ncbi:hypothetical protein I3760_15G025900 [Carya illinoinensis]|nr:hypothetical protein I3760_15G025900 [Carya illinoinensis]